jgi:hypothetical protein
MAKIRSDAEAPLQMSARGTVLTDETGRITEVIPETESATEPEQPVTTALTDDWQDMADAPLNRPIFLTPDPAADRGLLCSWRTTREKNKPPARGWSPRSFWASVLTKREIDFDPACWREAMAQNAAALQAVA